MAAIKSPSAGLDPSGNKIIFTFSVEEKNYQTFLIFQDNVHMIRIPLTKHLANHNSRKTKRWARMIFDDPKREEIILVSCY